MTDAREELIRDIFERWNAGEREIDSAAVDPDAVVHSAMTNTSYTGYEGIRRWMAEIDEQFESWQDLNRRAAGCARRFGRRTRARALSG